MSGSPVIQKANQLAESGRHAELADFLGANSAEDLERSAELALLFGTAHARLGHNEEGLRWVDLALHRSRERGERPTETRALNARGAIAFVGGELDEAADYFTQGLIAASRDADHGTIGRCSNNLGSISSLRGRYAEAVGSYSMAIGAFRRAEARQGLAEAHLNLAITFSAQEQWSRALKEATLAHNEAVAAGDRTLAGMALRGRAEVRLGMRDHTQAKEDIDQAVAMHRDVADEVEEAQDLRVAAAVLAAEGRYDEAEATLRGSLALAESQKRPHLAAEATRDLAHLLRVLERDDEALEAAKSAIARFDGLGAEAEVRKLDRLDWGQPIATDLHRALEPLHEAQRLADMGKYQELVTYLANRTFEELERSPTLALLSGIAHARTGRLDEGQQWVTIALTRARLLGHRPIEVRALNACGAIELERGGIDEARGFFMRAQTEALREGDLVTVGRCAQNLGIIANMQGDHGRAIGAYTMAVAAYQQAGYDRGVAECHHNLGVTYRDQGNLVEAVKSADDAVKKAGALCDQALLGQALAGRAEIRIALNEPELAVPEAERALELHRDMGDSVRETEDLRILGNALGAAGRIEDGETTLREVIDHAVQHGRLLLVASSQRDLARLLGNIGSVGEARDYAAAARENFERLGATLETKRIDAFIAGLPAAS